MARSCFLFCFFFFVGLSAPQVFFFFVLCRPCVCLFFLGRKMIRVKLQSTPLFSQVCHFFFVNFSPFISALGLILLSSPIKLGLGTTFKTVKIDDGMTIEEAGHSLVPKITRGPLFFYFFIF